MSAAEIVASVVLPLEVVLAEGRSVIVNDLRDWNGVLRADVSVVADGVEQAFGNPWIVVNPPCCVRVEGEAVHDPEAALREMIQTSGFFHG